MDAHPAEECRRIRVAGELTEAVQLYEKPALAKAELAVAREPYSSLALVGGRSAAPGPTCDFLCAAGRPRRSHRKCDACARRSPTMVADGSRATFPAAPLVLACERLNSEHVRSSLPCFKTLPRARYQTQLARSTTGLSSLTYLKLTAQDKYRCKASMFFLN